MNINPKTGKVWINNYTDMYGTLFSNQTHKYIQLDRYYDLIGKLEGRPKAAYAMILHNHISQVSCNRIPGVHKNIFMYIDVNRGRITNSKEMKEWICRKGWMNCDGSHLLNIASHNIWWITYKALVNVGLLSERTGILKAMVPIEGKFLPIPYATVAFLSRLKRDSELKNSIQQALLSIPDKIEENLKDVSREDLIKELIKVKTKGFSTSKNSNLVKMIFEEIRAVDPHRWGMYKNTEKYSKEVIVDISEKDIKEQIKNDQIKKQKGLDSMHKVKSLSVDDMHNFEPNNESNNSSNKTNKQKRNKRNKELPKESLDDNLFYADCVTKKDANKIKEIKINEDNSIKDKNTEECKDDECNFEILKDEKCDLFGLPIEDLDDKENEDIAYIPDKIEIQKVDEGFWDD